MNNKQEPANTKNRTKEYVKDRNNTKEGIRTIKYVGQRKSDSYLKALLNKYIHKNVHRACISYIIGWV